MKTQELRFRFQVRYPPEFADRRIKVGEGVTGLAAQSRQPVLINDVRDDSRYIEAVPNVCSELAIPLITKNRVIGVIDLEAREPGYFTEEHNRVLTLVASRMAAGIENAQLYTRTTKQARILLLLNEIARELTSILNLDELLGRIAELVRRLIDYQMFSILLVDSTGEKLEHRFSLRFDENIHLKNEIPLGRGIVGAAAESKQAVLVPDVTKDPRYVEADPETRSEMAVPSSTRAKWLVFLTWSTQSEDSGRRTPTHDDDVGGTDRDCPRECPTVSRSSARNGGWSAIFRLPANCKGGSCRRRIRSWPILMLRRN